MITGVGSENVRASHSKHIPAITFQGKNLRVQQP